MKHEKNTASARTGEAAAAGDGSLVSEIRSRSVGIALADWPTANERCAAVTIALASFVAQDRLRWTGGPEAGFSVRFEGVTVDLPVAPTADSFRLNRRYATPDDAGVLHDHILKDLDEALSVREHATIKADLARYWVMAKDDKARAAVLALTWAKLQRVPTPRRFSFDITSNIETEEIHCPSLGAGLFIANGAIVRAEITGV